MSESMVACFEQLDVITASNKKMLERNIELKERLVRRNGEKSALYAQKKNGKEEEQNTI
jgi:hypothetical protein